MGDWMLGWINIYASHDVVEWDHLWKFIVDELPKSHYFLVWGFQQYELWKTKQNMLPMRMAHGQKVS